MIRILLLFITFMVFPIVAYPQKDNNQDTTAYDKFNTVFPEYTANNIASSYYRNYFLAFDQPAKFMLSYKLKMDYNPQQLDSTGFYGAISILAMWQLVDQSVDVSNPFVDVNFMPEVFYLFDFRKTVPWFSLQFGFMHDSNGAGGEEIRNTVAWNQLYLEPQFHARFWNGYLGIKLRIWIPIGIADNQDLLEYYGIGYLQLFYKTIIKKRVGIQTDLTMRKGLSPDWKGALEWNFMVGPFFGKNYSVPLSLIFQIWYGYGETLTFYDQCYVKYRFGISIELF